MVRAWRQFEGLRKNSHIFDLCLHFACLGIAREVQRGLFVTLTITQAIMHRNQMLMRGFTVSTVPAKVDQKRRDLIMRDVQQVFIVVHFDVPQNMWNYLRRIGRIGGYCVTTNVVTSTDVRFMKSVITTPRSGTCPWKLQVRSEA